MGLFAREPTSFVEDIPVFIERDEYVANYERIAADHLEAEARTSQNPFIDERLWQASEDSTAALIARHVRPGDRVLDVGVGLGRLLSRFPQLERHGVDISIEYLLRARATGVDVALARVEDLPYPPETFDAVLATDVLEHVLDLNDAVEEMLGVLRPGGVLIVRTPNREDLTAYVAPDFPYRFVHLRHFDRPSMILLFDRVFGCEVLDIVEAGYFAHGEYFRWRIPIPKVTGGISEYILGPIARIHPRIAAAVLPRCFRPVEINVVVRKPSAAVRQR